MTTEKNHTYKLSNEELIKAAIQNNEGIIAVSYTHLTLPTTPYV